MRRRTVLAGLGATLAAGLPLAKAQQFRPMPIVGFLSGRSHDVDAPYVVAFSLGLAGSGYNKGRDVEIAYVSAEGEANRLPALAAELVRRRVTVIFASASNSAIAAKAATATIPIVFTGASDPVGLGLVASLRRPGGNLTGVTMFSHTFSAKRLELLHELLPAGRGLGVLVNPDNPSSASELQDVQTVARELGQTLTVCDVGDRSDIDTAFAVFVQHQVDMLYLVDDPLFNGLRKEIAALAIRHAITAVSALREFAEAGFVASFGPSFTEVHRQCGLYVGRILKGESPGDLR